MTRALVVGAGVAGLAAARALRARGVDVVVVDRRDGPPTTGFGLNLPGNAVRVLDRLGLAEEVRAIGEPVVRRDYRTDDDRLLFDTDDAALWRRVGTPVAVRHERLVSVLAEDQDVCWGRAVRGLDPVGDVVRVDLGEGVARRFDLVVGADGVRSVVREAVAPGLRPRPSAMTAASWRFVTTDPGVEHWTYWSGRRVGILLLPLPAGEVYGYATATSADPTGHDPGWLRRAFDAFPPLVRRAVASAPAGVVPPRMDPVEEVVAPTWHRGRVVVIGDAAHATGPVWAQGAAMGLEDAVTLAEHVAAVGASAAGLPSTLGGWEARRRPRVEHVRRQTDRMSRVARMPDGLLRITAPRSGPRGYHATYRPLRDEP